MSQVLRVIRVTRDFDHSTRLSFQKTVQIYRRFLRGYRQQVSGAVKSGHNLFIVKAFASELFTGNPAAVCILPRLYAEDQLQKIARELNQPITSFVVPRDDGQYLLRHFGPSCQVEICGHGTLAASHVIREYLNHASNRIRFCLGRIKVSVVVSSAGFEIEMPKLNFMPIAENPVISRFLGMKPLRIYQSFYDVIAEFPSEQSVRGLSPDFSVPLPDSFRAILVTGPGDQSDYCYRVFAPSIGVNEDFFCGSANGALGPFWSYKLGKLDLLGRSVSERGGLIPCRVDTDSVHIMGRALTWFSGSIEVGACA